MDLNAYTARLQAALASGLPVEGGEEPNTLAEAYEIQRLSGAPHGDAVAGWKVADHPVLGPVAAPIFGPLSKPDGSNWTFRPGLGIEIEVALRLRRDLPRGTYSREAILDAVDQVRLGVEMVGTRLAPGNRNAHAALADRLANAGYVMGAQSGLWPDKAIAGRACRLTLDGELIHDAPADPPKRDALAITAAWLAVAGDRCGGFRAGQFVTTGSLCGVVPVPRPGRAVASLEGFGTVDIMIEA